jgi:hypothetical protein
MPIACLPEDKRLFTTDGAGGACGIRGPLRIAASPWLDLTTVGAERLNSFRRSRLAHMLDELKRLSA